jgi:hypothetical protein
MSQLRKFSSVANDDFWCCSSCSIRITDRTVLQGATRALRKGFGDLEDSAKIPALPYLDNIETSLTL